MNPSNTAEQWQSFHDACLAEAKTLIDSPGKESVIHSLASTAAVCVDVLQKLNQAPQPIVSLRDIVYGIPNRTDIP